MSDFPGYGKKRSPSLDRKVSIVLGDGDVHMIYENGQEVKLERYSGDERGARPFVMMENGGVLVGSSGWHSTLSGGQDVAAAGMLYKYELGGEEYLLVTDRSGHYTPGKSFTIQFLKELERRGVDLSRVYIIFYDQRLSPPQKASEVLSNPLP